MGRPKRTTVLTNKGRDRTKDKVFFIPVKSNKVWHSIYFLADVHLGAAAHDAEGLKETIREIKKDPNAYWLGVGDYGDHIYYNDPRFSLNEVDDLYTVADMREGIMGQVRKLVRVLEPIGDKCIGLGTGNHEEKVLQKFNVDATREMCYALRVKYLGYSSIVTLRPVYTDPSGNRSSKTLQIYQHHGFGGGRRHGPQINKVEDAMRIAEADIYAMGHVHGKVASALDMRAADENGNEFLKPKVFLVTSSYQKAFKQGTLTFAEKNMYPQSALKSPVVQFKLGGEERRVMLRMILDAG